MLWVQKEGETGEKGSREVMGEGSTPWDLEPPPLHPTPCPACSSQWVESGTSTHPSSELGERSQLTSGWVNLGVISSLCFGLESKATLWEAKKKKEQVEIFN